jgi:hypothetical protein
MKLLNAFVVIPAALMAITIDGAVAQDAGDAREGSRPLKSSAPNVTRFGKERIVHLTVIHPRSRRSRIRQASQRQLCTSRFPPRLLRIMQRY